MISRNNYRILSRLLYSIADWYLHLISITLKICAGKDDEFEHPQICSCWVDVEVRASVRCSIP